MHHVENGSVHDTKAAFSDELLVLLTHSARKLGEGQLRNIAARADSEPASAEREQERECAEVVPLGEVCTQRTRHTPELLLPVGERLFVSEEVRITLHRNSESLSQNIVPSGRSLLGTLDILVVRRVRHSLAEVWLSFDPHSWVGNFVYVVELIVPD